MKPEPFFAEQILNAPAEVKQWEQPLLSEGVMRAVAVLFVLGALVFALFSCTVARESHSTASETSVPGVARQ